MNKDKIQINLIFQENNICSVNTPLNKCNGCFYEFDGYYCTKYDNQTDCQEGYVGIWKEYDLEVQEYRKPIKYFTDDEWATYCLKGGD